MKPLRVIPDVLDAEIGEGMVVARRGRREVFVLNQAAAESWRAMKGLPAGEDGTAVVGHHLTARYGLPRAMALAEAERLRAMWQEAGLLDTPGEACAASEPCWIVTPPAATQRRAGHIGVAVAGLAFALDVPDARLRDMVARHLRGLPVPAGGRCQHVLRLAGDDGAWTLLVNGAPLGAGEGADAALAGVVTALADLAAQAEDRLLVVHGAGLARRDGSTLLLVAASGAGKTTLATALNAGGLALLSDDVVPVTRAGAPLALGLPICVKQGSWPVLAAARPDLAAVPPVGRMGQSVRFLPPLPQPVDAPLAVKLMLFPAYTPGRAAAIERLTPEQVLQRLIEAQSIIRDLDAEKLGALARWVSAVPGHAISYPSLGEAVAMVRELFPDG